LHEGAGEERVLPEGGAADHEQRVVRCERPAQARAVAGQMAGKPWMVLGEAGAAAERLLPDRACEPLGERDERRPGARLVRAGTGDERRPLARGEERGELPDDAVVG